MQVSDAGSKNRAPSRRRLARFARGAAVYGLIIAATLAVLDVMLIALGLFPPTYNYGHPDLGWVAAYPTGEMREEGCTDLATGRVLYFTRNEDALRTSHGAAELRDDSVAFKVAVGGDSHTELCATNDSTHFGVLERELAAHGKRASVFAFGAGKYSPLQAYLALRPAIREYGANAFVLNLYTGNDFYDLLRIDDRPHFVESGDSFEVAPPVWYQEDPPGLKRRSRVLFAMRSLAQKTGVRNVLLRVRYLQDVARSQGQGLASVVGYTNDLRRASADELGYPQAFTAQMLNQQLFFERFPGSREESIRRVRALLQLIRRENPGTLLVLSPLPSYQLVYRSPSNPSFSRVLERVGLTHESGVAQEGELYGLLSDLARQEGWVFVDNLRALRSLGDTVEMFNAFDYHLLPVASAAIGAEQARVIDAALRQPADSGKAAGLAHNAH